MPGILALVLENLYVLCLKALGAVGDAKLHRLAFLQTLKSIRLDSGEMHENISAIAAADETISFCVIEPFHCSLFHYLYLFFYLNFLLQDRLLFVRWWRERRDLLKIAGKSH